MEQEKVLEAIQAKFDEFKENLKVANPEIVDGLKSEFTTFTENVNEKFEGSDEKLKEIKDYVENLKEQFDTFSTVTTEVKEDDIRKGLEAVVEDVKGYAKTRTAAYKTVGTMSLGTSVTGQMPQADRESGIANVVRQAFTIRNGSNVFPTNSNLVEWVEQQNIEGSAGMTGEGLAKTQLDWEYVVSNASVKKITSYVKITEEMLNDIDGMMGEINGNLQYQVELKEETQLITGLNGIEKYAQALDLASLISTFDNGTANNWDVIGAAITQIRVNGEGELRANRVYLNPVDVFLTIHNTKDTTKDYINPVTVIPNVTPGGLPSIFIWGVPVVESDSITAGEFLVADMTRFNIRDLEGMTVSVGLENDDFTKNLVTIRGEKRLATYVKANYVEGFCTDTFADGIAFLEVAS
jgi:HK97 family phage major capsid protein